MRGDTRSLVLVADDDAAIVEVISETLAAAGCAVATAPDGETALTLAATLRPALLLADVHMPLLDGVALAHQARDLFSGPLPIILMSANRPAAPPEGVPFLAKPFDLDALLALVDAALALPA